MDDHFLTAQELTFGTELATTTTETSDGTTALALPIQPDASVAVATACSNESDAGPKIIYLDRVCRTCLTEKEKEHLKDLFEFGLAETVMACVSISLEESDGLPSHICMDCLQEVERVINFRQLCARSDASIRSLLEKSVVINQDSETKYEVLNVVLTDASGNTETSAVVVPIEELRFQLVNCGQSTSAAPQDAIDSIPVAELANNSLELPTTTQPEVHHPDNSIQITIPGKNMQLNLTIPSEDVDLPQSTIVPSELLNETSPTPLQEGRTNDNQQQQESTILLNLRQELSEFIGGGTEGSTKPSQELEDDDEMIHVDYLKDALTELI